MNPFRKPCREKSPAFLDFLRGRKCVRKGCRSVETEAHHVHTRGAGGSDLLAIPLCRKHHTETHDRGAETFEIECMSEPYVKVQLQQLHEFVAALPIPEDMIPWGPVSRLGRKFWCYVASGETYPHRGWFGRNGWEFDEGKKVWSKDWSLSLPWDLDVSPVFSMDGVILSLLVQGGVNGDRLGNDLKT